MHFKYLVNNPCPKQLCDEKKYFKNEYATCVKVQKYYVKTQYLQSILFCMSYRVEKHGRDLQIQGLKLKIF